MGRYIRPAVIIFIAFLIVGSCNGSGGSNTTTRTIGPEGGTIRSSDRKLTLEIPAGALDEDTEITIRRLSDDEISEEFGDTEIDCAYELTPESLNFNMPVRASVRLRDNPNQADGTLSANAAFLFSESGDVIEFLENTELEVDGTGDMTTVSADLTHFTELVTVTSNGVTATLDMTKEEDIPNTFIGTLTVTASTAILQMIGAIIVNDSGADLPIPCCSVDFDNLPIPLSGGVSKSTINGQCKREIEPKLYIVNVAMEQVDIAELFTFGFIRPASILGAPPKPDDDLEQVGLVPLLTNIMSEIVCNETEEDDTPPPPPTMPPSPVVPTFGVLNIDGTWSFNCPVLFEAFDLIDPNLGDPVIFDAELIVIPETLELMILPLDDIFILDGTLVPQPNGDFLYNGSGSGFLGDMNPNAANIQIEAEDWIFSMDVPDSFGGNNQPGDVFVDDGLLRFNFPTLPLDNQSSLAECDGMRTGD